LHDAGELHDAGQNQQSRKRVSSPLWLPHVTQPLILQRAPNEATPNPDSIDVQRVAKRARGSVSASVEM